MPYLPSNAELESCYDNYYYNFIVDPKDTQSFLVKPRQVKGTPEEARRAWQFSKYGTRSWQFVGVWR